MLMTPLCTIPRPLTDIQIYRNCRYQGTMLQNAYPQDLSIIFDWGIRNLVSFNASETQFLHLSTRQNPPHNYPLFFNNTQLSPSPTLNCLGLSFTQKLNWKFHISSLPKSASSRLGVMYRPAIFLPPPNAYNIQGLCLPLYVAYTSFFTSSLLYCPNPLS